MVNTSRSPISKRILIWERKPATELQAAYGHGRLLFGTKTPRPRLTACPLWCHVLDGYPLMILDHIVAQDVRGHEILDIP